MNVGIVGLGNMGGAIARGLLRSGMHASSVLGFDVDAAQAARVGCTPATMVQVAACDVVVVAVKPPLVSDVVKQVASASLVVSVAAGVPLARLRATVDEAGGRAAVVRAMPNTAAAVGASATAMVAMDGLDASLRDRADAVFAAVGSTIWLANESLMHVATALVGSAPAFVYVLAEALADGAVLEGMPRAQARSATAAMLTGAAALLSAHAGSPAELKDGVASPGGTTIAGLRALEDGGFRAAMIGAISATARRSRELAP